MPESRKVPQGTAWRIAQSTMGLMACEYANAADEHHDHGNCIVDDESFVADRMLRLLAATVAGDEDQALDRLTELRDCIDRTE